MNKNLAVTFIMRNSSAENWTTRNPVLKQGEIGLESNSENNTYLIKIGDGVTQWSNLPYINKLDAFYFKRTDDGSLTFSDSFAQTINNIIANAGENAHLVINDDPVLPTDPVNLRYLEWAIEHANHLKREVVLTLPAAAEADINTLYMVPAQTGNYYEEYMIVNGNWDMVGSTGDGGSSGNLYTLPIATTSRLGGVKASDDIAVNESTGVMTIAQVSTSKLYVPLGDTLTLYGGTA